MSSPTLGGVRGSVVEAFSEDTELKALNYCEFLQCLVRIAILR